MSDERLLDVSEPAQSGGVSKQTQCDRVLELLADGREHSTIEFVELGILRLSARVLELRRRGFTIDVRAVAREGRSTIYVYRLADQLSLFVEAAA